LDKNIKLCFISHSAGIAGAEKAFPKLLQGLQNKNLDILVLLPDHGPLEEVLSEKNIKYKVIRYSRWINNDKSLLNRIKRTIKNLLMIFPIINFLYKWKCNIVYTNTSTIISGAIAAKILNIPHIWHFREFGEEDYGYYYDLGPKLSKSITKYLADQFLANSFAVRNKYSEFIPDDKINVLYESYFEVNTTNINEHPEIKSNFFNCIMIGTLHEAKGHFDSLKALAAIVQRYSNINLYIVGTGDNNYKNNLIEFISTNRLVDNIVFTGHLNYPGHLLSKCDCLLMCSRNEAYGLVTLEAMKLGIPVIGTNSGGTAELIDNKKTGLLYEPGNIKELTEKLEILIKDKDYRLLLGKNARNKAIKYFDPQNYIDSTYDIILKVINNF